jgi:non-ribosomal peptide synthetase component F
MNNAHGTYLNLLDGLSLEKVWTWNQQVPQPIEACVHHLIEEQALSASDDYAVKSWDGKMSYSDLDRHSDDLACYLASLGVGPGSMVPVCFDKSLWVVMTMLGVLKAGAAFVPIDLTQAPERREMVLKRVNTSIILTSEELKTILPATQIATSWQYTLLSRSISSRSIKVRN